MDRLRSQHLSLRKVIVLLSVVALVLGIASGSDARAKRKHRNADRVERTTECTDPGPCDEDQEICDNGIDDDLDGLVDGEDETDCPPPDVCADGLDNEPSDPPEGGTDGPDLLDPEDCPSDEGPPGDPSCEDQFDNDKDGLVDLEDPDCQLPATGGGGGSAPGPAAPEAPPEPEPQAPDLNPCAHPTIVGTPLNDKIKGTKGIDIIDGLEGKDKIRAKRGDDIICGGPGNDKLRGGRGNDIVLGDEGREKARGGPGVDDVDGGPDFDKCRNGRGNDPAVRNCEKILGPGASLK